MTEGHFLTLSTAQAEALARKLGDNPAAPPNQWVELGQRAVDQREGSRAIRSSRRRSRSSASSAGRRCSTGHWPALGLFIGARRWLGRFGGLAAVGLYCSSGAALAFAWRDYMPTFTDASLVAAGSGLLLWAVLATEASSRRRTWVGLAGFVAIEIATFVRYTNIVILGCAVVAVVVAWRLRAARLPLRTLCWWLASVALFGAGVAIFDDLVYGGPLTTGYQPGEVTFSLGAIGPNLRLMPAHLMQAMPMLVLGLIALAWIVVRWLMLRRAGGQAGAAARRDLWVGVALAASWLAIWGLYSAYTWTTDPTSVTVQVRQVLRPGARRDRPARRLARDQASRPCTGWAGLTSAAVITAMFGLGVWSFYAMYAAFGVPLSG